PAATTAASPVVSASPSATGTPGGTVAYDKNHAPAVPQPELGKKYSGQKITYYGDSVGAGHDIDMVLATQFTKDTGIEINVVPHPQSSDDTYAQYLRFFQGKSSDMDVMMLDVVWPGAFAPHLHDLSSALGDLAKQHYDTIVANDTVNGKLVAMPWFSDFGMLFYRTDLLQKYGYSDPPATWDDLESMAKKIVDGEKAANSNFVGFVFQGAAYEGLTCDALEWLASTGGGTLYEDGKVTVNNPQAVAMLNKARGWIGTIAPKGVTSYKEEDARNVFQGGNSAFMRNWPYAYNEGQAADSPIKGKFDVTPLPAQSGQKNVGTIGGWALGVSAYSKSPDASVEFVRYMTSPDVETWRAVVGSYVPTIPSVADSAAVLQAMPFLKPMASVERVPRPSGPLGDKYNQFSTYFFQGVNSILNGQDASSVVPNMAQQMTRAAG
ncbi:MAG TPA: ABC transporter substrate-binding protein, partial [Thermomicrobiaceae bacterium]|nr:ABC transporter substrate-binding protein [Thermomicrobiaceae bacterium]